MIRGQHKFIYEFRQVKYEVIGVDDNDSLRLVNDFKYCESIGDYQTIKNRITGGVKWGWMKPLP
jgi:hypothetical protein